MADLPQYQKIPTSDSQEGESNAEPTTYPPRPPAGNPGLQRVTFTYNPQYPHQGSLQHVIGLLGPTHEQTIDTLARYFPSLAEFPAERLSLTLAHAAQCESGSAQRDKPNEWAVLTEDVWPSVVADPPERLGVVLADSPAEESQRSRRDCCIGMSIICVPSILIGYFVMRNWLKS